MDEGGYEEHRPYNRRRESLFHPQSTTFKVLCLETFEAHYVTQKGGYTAPHYSSRKVWSIPELVEAGFVLLPWDGTCVTANVVCNIR